MIEIKGKTIAIGRGESLPLKLSFSKDVPEDGTEVRFTVKKKTEDVSALIEVSDNIEDGEVCIQLSHDDTNQSPGTYVWDVQLVYENGDVSIPMDPAPFLIKEAVGRV